MVKTLSIISFFLFFILFVNIFTTCLFYFFFKKKSYSSNYYKMRFNKSINGSININKDINVGINIPAYNEQSFILKTINSCSKLNYKYGKIEIIVVSDGSTDNTEKIVIEKYNMKKRNQSPVYNFKETKKIDSIYKSMSHPYIQLIVKKNGGKADSLNAGIKYFSKGVSLVLCVDADTIIEKQSLNYLVEEMLQDPLIYGTTGVVIPAFFSFSNNTFRKIFELFLLIIQKIDYCCSFYLQKPTQSIRSSVMIISGAFGLFNRNVLMDIGGYDKGLSEDMALCLKLQNRFYKRTRGVLSFCPKAYCYTSAPRNIRDLKTQRIRWFKGALQSLNSSKQSFLRFNFFSLLLYEFFIIEMVVPIFLPLLLYLVISKKGYLFNYYFYGMIFLNFVGFVLSLLLEFKERRKLHTLFLLLFYPLYFTFSVLQVVFKIVALVTFRNKSWGVFKKRY